MLFHFEMTSHRMCPCHADIACPAAVRSGWGNTMWDLPVKSLKFSIDIQIKDKWHRFRTAKGISHSNVVCATFTFIE